jgi:aspartyl-tRNA(Asn)/glutamyl-tRNA(Gln) amidotransferase subunit A
VYTSIAQYHQQLQAGTTNCHTTVLQYIEVITANTHLNAFVQVYEEEALHTAQLIDNKIKAGQPLGKLYGVVIAIKDVICYKGHTVTAASKILAGFTSVYTATALQRLIDEDAIIIGSCNCDEFAMGSTNENSAYGKVLNAANTLKVPGGSSGGSAVAVQANMCMLSLGSDTGGSVRQPADFCGIIGIKPSYGYISRYGLIAYASSFDQIGIFGKQLNDVALALQIMGGPDDFDSTALQQVPTPLIAYQNNQHTISIPNNKKFKIAYFNAAIQHPSLDVEIKNAITNCCKQLQQNNHLVQAVDFDLLEYIVPAYYVLTTAEASTNLSRFDGVRYGHRTTAPVKDLNDFYKKNRSEGFGIEVQRRIMLGTFVLSAGYYDAYFSKAQQVRQLLVNKVTAIFKQYDAIILPTSPTTAFNIGEKLDDPIAMYVADIYTVFANLTGLPSISIPLFTHSNGMPFGLQIMTDTCNESTMLQLAQLLLQQYQKV